MNIPLVTKREVNIPWVTLERVNIPWVTVQMLDYSLGHIGKKPKNGGFPIEFSRLRASE